ncbi:MAG: hypothetical protein R2844_23095 [Caldilineales bacterium]
MLLLLDEGDALMSKRTEVRNASDRYANLETNYLLQRLETYEGDRGCHHQCRPAHRQRVLRRLDVIIPFAAQRERALADMDAASAGRQPRQPRLSRQGCQPLRATGGQIRNAALHATLLALETGQPLGGAHLEEAVQRRYRKAKRPFPCGRSAATAIKWAWLRHSWIR